MKAVREDPGDPNNINFGRAVNLDYAGWYPLDLDLPEFFSLAALRAHKMYWTALDEFEYDAFARIAPEILGAALPLMPATDVNQGALTAAIP